MHFCFIFVIFAFQGVHSSHFSHHFSFHFLDHSDHSSPKHVKMSQKWPKNVYCEQPYYLQNIQGGFALQANAWECFK